LGGRTHGRQKEGSAACHAGMQQCGGVPWMGEPPVASENNRAPERSQQSLISPAREFPTPSSTSLGSKLGAEFHYKLVVNFEQATSQS